MLTADKRSAAKHARPWLKAYAWPKGTSGNPGGKPKHDVASEIAQAVFSENKAEIYAAMRKGLLRGNAYVFKELAERAYGKLTDHQEIAFKDTSDANLDERIAELERDLGLRPGEPVSGVTDPALPAQPEAKPDATAGDDTLLQ